MLGARVSLANPGRHVDVAIASQANMSFLASENSLCSVFWVTTTTRRFFRSPLQKVTR